MLDKDISQMLNNNNTVLIVLSDAASATAVVVILTRHEREPIISNWLSFKYGTLINDSHSF